MESMIRDIKLAPGGHDKIEWVKNFMPVMRAVDEEFSKTKPFAGKKMVITLHLEAKTAYMAEVFMHAGAEVAITGSNPLSTQDDVAAALVEDGVNVFAWHDCTEEEYFKFIDEALKIEPDFIIDDGGDLVHALHTTHRDLLPKIVGGSEETTTGVHRLRGLAQEGKLEFPMIAANDAYMKFLFDNRYGTGQSTWDGIMRTTNLVIAGKTVVIAGYGWCGKGGAMRARGLGANVVITEVDPIKAIEAVFDGFRVMPMDEAAKIGDIFLTLTGDKDVIVKRHFESMKDGVRDLLQRRDGLMCGVCNGFQALIKLGLVPYGDIIDTDETCPTLTYNTIGRHQSKLVRTRVASNKSPWLKNAVVGGVYTVPISHGEGRFLCSEELLRKLAANGQIATQYVDLDGNPTTDVQYNPNNSAWAVEGITSPDGRVFGRMGHSERVGPNLYKNVPGQYNMGMFHAAVEYFK